MKVKGREHASLEEPRFRGATGTRGKEASTGLFYLHLDRMIDGFRTILVHPESLEEIRP